LVAEEGAAGRESSVSPPDESRDFLEVRFILDCYDLSVCVDAQILCRDVLLMII
jgi:hypothetical protein